MGSPILYEFGLTKIHMFKGPILEIGSKDYSNTTSFRAQLPDQKYIGIDMEEGNNVDLVLDFTEDYDVIERALDGEQFGTVFCLSVLEHCANPFKMADNIQRILKPGGILFVSAPFSWRVHGYPDDYWRFTPSGLRLLFPEIQFNNDDCCLSTTKPGDYYTIEDFPRSEFDIRKGQAKGQYGKLMAAIIKFVWRYQLLPWLVRWPYLYPPINANMIGTKQPAPPT
jgi:SAM-dependent methyltransferase